MKKASRYSIDYQGLSQGGHSFVFDFGDDLFTDGVEAGILGGEGRVEIGLSRHSNFMELGVRISGVVRLECDRCLDEYQQDIDWQGELVVKITEQEGEYDGDIIWLHPAQSRLDLGDWIYESIVLSLPIQRVHNDLGDCNPDVVRYITGDADQLPNADGEE